MGSAAPDAAALGLPRRDAGRCVRPRGRDDRCERSGGLPQTDLRRRRADHHRPGLQGDERPGLLQRLRDADEQGQSQQRRHDHHPHGRTGLHRGAGLGQTPGLGGGAQHDLSGPGHDVCDSRPGSETFGLHETRIRGQACRNTAGDDLCERGAHSPQDCLRRTRRTAGDELGPGNGALQRNACERRGRFGRRTDDDDRRKRQIRTALVEADGLCVHFGAEWLRSAGGRTDSAQLRAAGRCGRRSGRLRADRGGKR